MGQFMYTSLFPHLLLLICSVLSFVKKGACCVKQEVSEVALLMICMYVCMAITYNRVLINRVRLSNLLVVS